MATQPESKKRKHTSDKPTLSDEEAPKKANKWSANAKSFPFAQYGEDEAFGGTKKWIRISQLNSREYDIWYINEQECDVEECIWYRHCIRAAFVEDVSFLRVLLRRGILRAEEVYDMNDPAFLQSVIKEKVALHVLFEEYPASASASMMGHRIWELFLADGIINQKHYCTMMSSWTFDCRAEDQLAAIPEFGQILVCVNADARSRKVTILKKIQSQFYDYELCLRRFLPYVVCQVDGDKNYVIKNRDDEWIAADEFDAQAGKEREEKWNTSVEWESPRLFDIDTAPWDGEDHFRLLVQKFRETTASLGACLNRHDITSHFLSLYD